MKSKDMKKLILFFIFFGFVSTPVRAADQSRPITIEMAPDDSLSLAFVNAHIKVLTHPGNQAIVRIQKISHPEVEGWVVVMQKIGKRTELSVRMPESRATFQQIIKNEMIPLYNVEVSMPERALDLGVRRGNVQITNLNARLNVHVQNGEVSILGGEGDLYLTHQEGLISIKGRRGRQHIESFSGRLIAEKISGHIEIDNFMGDTNLKQVEGSLFYSSTKGNGKLNSVKGRMEYSLGHGNLNILELSASLKGQSQQANVQCQIRGEADVHLQSQEGAVNLTLIDSKANLQLSSQEGNIVVPNFLKVTDLGTQKNLRGQLRGAAQGNVVVKTTAGSIHIH